MPQGQSKAKTVNEKSWQCAVFVAIIYARRASFKIFWDIPGIALWTLFGGSINLFRRSVSVIFVWWEEERMLSLEEIQRVIEEEMIDDLDAAAQECTAPDGRPGR
ncbi:hypothetical protein [Streptomyces sp. NPDC096132]|uniref:hypothetical protein n=1 Tax=Streptomyces sp. NPDC096132 TaxID=3366075 RepID=UPI0038064F99